MTVLRLVCISLVLALLAWPQSPANKSRTGSAAMPDDHSVFAAEHATQNLRLSRIEDSIQDLKAADQVNGNRIEALQRQQDQWIGGLKTLAGLIAASNVGMLVFTGLGHFRRRRERTA